MATSRRVTTPTAAPASRPAVTRRPAAPVARRTSVPSRPGASAIPPAPMHRLTMEYVRIEDIVPYEWNPRQNADAVKAVAASMRQTEGFAMPVVVDVNNVLVAGHTRIEAAKLLGYVDAPVVRLSHLSPEAINAFRIIDNKVSEQAKWDYDLLAGEIGKLKDMGLDFTEYGWTQGDLDCMSELVSADCLSVETLAPVADAAAAEASAAAGRRAPQQARFVLGELVFFLPIERYRVWADGIRQLNNFNDDDIAADLQRRLGINIT